MCFATAVLRKKCGLVLALLTAGCGPTGEQDESVQDQRSYLTISPTAVFQIKSAATGKCIGIAGNSTANNAAAEVRTCNGLAGQNFTLASVATGYYAIKNTNSLKCLDVTGKSTADGAAVIQHTCSAGATNQQWAIADTSGGDGSSYLAQQQQGDGGHSGSHSRWHGSRSAQVERCHLSTVPALYRFC